jgi:hypothetical protein
MPAVVRDFYARSPSDLDAVQAFLVADLYFLPVYGDFGHAR